MPPPQAGDPRRAKAVAAQIVELAQAHGFDRDLGLDLKGDRDGALAKLDEHICDLKELQIRDGLHILGEGPAGPRSAPRRWWRSPACRAGQGEAGDASLLRALAEDLGLGFDPLDCRFAELGRGRGRRRWRISLPPCGGGQGRGEGPQLARAPWRTYGDTVERLEALALDLVSALPSECNRCGRLGTFPSP